MSMLAIQGLKASGGDLYTAIVWDQKVGVLIVVFYWFHLFYLQNGLHSNSSELYS